MIDTLDDGPFVGVWLGGKLFGFMSTITAGLMVPELAPKEVLGYWNGRQEGARNIAEGIAPLIFAPIYDAIGNKRGTEMLGATAFVSFLAILAYLPLVARYPKKRQEEKLDLVLKDLTIYESMPDDEFSQLPMEIIDKVTVKMMEAGKVPRIVCWGDYQKERSTLGGLRERALGDFKYYSEQMMRMLTDRKELLKEQANYKQFEEMVPKPDRDKAKLEMGAWIADYFDDAGYAGWEVQSNIYKAMILAAFPPIDPLDDIKPDFATMSPEHFEDNVAKFLEVMDTHLATEQRRLSTGVSSSTIRSLMSRR